MIAISADATHHRREVQHQVRLRIVKQTDNGLAVPQIVLTTPRREDVCAASRLESIDHERPEKARTPGDDDPLFLPEVHSLPIILPAQELMLFNVHLRDPAGELV